MSFKNKLITSKKEAVDLTTELSLNSVYITIQGQFGRNIYSDRGKETENLFIQDGDSGNLQFSFEGDDMDKLSEFNIEKAVKELIAKVEEKYK